MKKILIGIILSLIVLGCFSQPIINSNSDKITLLLVHPTEYNLNLFNYLVETKIVSVEYLEIIGVYHSMEVYDYSQSERFLDSMQINYIQLQMVSENIMAENIYQKNSCSDIYSELFKKSNGILFFGGPDLPSSIYNEETSLLTEISDPYRHYFEASFLFHLLGGKQNMDYKPLLDQKPDYTVYGICLGMQTMNVATGGSMIQDIPTEIYSLNSVEQVLLQNSNSRHRNYNNNLTVNSELFAGHFHEILIPQTMSFIGDEKMELSPLVYSNHHQAIEQLGKNLIVLATSVDKKIIEAIGHREYPNVLGIQFHPEGTYLHNPEIKYKVSPNDLLMAGYDILKNHGSYDFHLAIWKEFSRKLSLQSQDKK